MVSGFVCTVCCFSCFVEWEILTADEEGGFQQQAFTRCVSIKVDLFFDIIVFWNGDWTLCLCFCQNSLPFSSSGIFTQVECYSQEYFMLSPSLIIQFQEPIKSRRIHASEFVTLQKINHFCLYARAGFFNSFQKSNHSTT